MMMRVTHALRRGSSAEQQTGPGLKQQHPHQQRRHKGSAVQVEARLYVPLFRVSDAPVRRQDVRLLGLALGAPCRASSGVLGYV